MIQFEKLSYGSRQLFTEAWLPVQLDDVFAFFSDAKNLELLTPPWLRFEILTPTPIAMQSGTILDYRLRLHGIPLRWQSEISVWEAPHRFVDRQTRGPYRIWEHEHTFAERAGGTVVTDKVRYRVPGGSLIDRFFVRGDLRRIFAYRRKVMLAHFQAQPNPQLQAVGTA